MDTTDMSPAQAVEDSGGPVFFPEAGPIDVYVPPDAGLPIPRDASVGDAGSDAATVDAAMPAGDLLTDLINAVGVLVGGNSPTKCAMAACGSALDCQFGLSVLDCGFTDCVAGFCKK